MSWIKNIITILLSLILSLIIAELTLRIIVGPPRMLSSDNFRIDENFGFKVNELLDEIDNAGFRNNAALHLDYDIAAIGDSHTFGINVLSDAAWPKLLSNLINEKVYNFGILGNGIYSYHYLILSELKKGKDIVLGLYTPNDFIPDGYYCAINFNNDFWLEEITRLSLKVKPCKSNFSHQMDKRSNNLRSLVLELTKKFTLLSLVRVNVYRPIKKFIYKNDQVLSVGRRLKPIKRSKLEGQSKGTDLKSADINRSFSDFLKMLKEWNKNSEEGQLGIMLIPSRQVVYRALIESNDAEKTYPGYEELVIFTENELYLESLLMNEVTKMNIPILSSKSLTVQALKSDLATEIGEENFYPDGGHPSYAGYKAYAGAARDLVSIMSILRRENQN